MLSKSGETIPTTEGMKKWSKENILMILKEHKNLILFLIIFIISKLYFLQLPFYWDEAWSYLPAIKSILDNGFSIKPELLKGHPPVFYFLAAIFAKVFGFNVFSLHSFALLISCYCLISFYQLCSIFLEKRIAFLVTILLALQSVIFVQSTMVLPEIMLLSFFLQTQIAGFQNNWKKYSIAGVLLVLTKETGLVIYGLSSIIFLFQKKINFSNFKYLLFPPIAFGLFIIYNYLVESWFLYPTHVSLFHFDENVLKSIEGFFSFIFIAQGRNVLTISILVFLGYLAIKKYLVDSEKLIALLSILVGYTLFSAFNFYSPRYMIVAVAILVLIFGLIIHQLSFSKKIKGSIFLVVILASFWGLIFDKKENDYSLGFADAVSVQKEAIQFLGNELDFSSEIYCGFLSSYYINENYMAYNKTNLRANTTFNHQSYILISSNETEYLEGINLTDYSFLKGFGDDKIWVKIWKLNTKSTGSI